MTCSNPRLLAAFAAVVTLASACNDDSSGAGAPNTGNREEVCRPGIARDPKTGEPAALEVGPPPASIGADVPATYFGPAPSFVNPKLVGPVQLLKAGTVDLEAGTITLPLYQGSLAATGQPVWFILTDTDDAENATALGLNFSAKLAYAHVPGTQASRTGHVDRAGNIVFDQGTVSFAPERSVTAGSPVPFPPAAFQPGSMGDASYSPLVRLENAGGHTYNAPVIAFDVPGDTLAGFCDGPPDHALVHDKVVRICRGPGVSNEFTVTLALTAGFSFGRPVFYLSTEASDPLVATLEGATLAPGLADVGVGRDDSAFSAIERIFVVVNGPQNLSPHEVNPQRQGLYSALTDGRGPLNVLGGIPTIATDYSPLWDVNAAVWTEDAIAKGYRSRVNEEFQILGLVERGFLTGLGGGPFGSIGVVVNCPIVQRLL